MEGKRFFTWIVILIGLLFSISCSSIDVRREQACPMFGDLHFDFSGKKNLTVEGYNGIVKVSVDETTKAKAIDTKEKFNAFLESYKSICGQEPPFYNEIAYVRKMKVEADRQEQEELLSESEKKKQEVFARQKTRKQTGLNLDTLEMNINRIVLLKQESKELEEAGQTIKARKKQTEIELAWKEIEKSFSVGRTISGNVECPFERVPIGDRFATRLFKLSCFDNENSPLDLHFEFSVLGDDWGWRTNSTNNSIAEIFEAGTRFAGSTQIVKEGIDMKHVALHDIRLDGSSKSKINVRVKITSLKPVN